MRKEKIKGARVLITGASSGIGKATAFEFAKKGAVLAITARNLNRLSKVAEQINHAFPEIPAPFPVSCDVTDDEDVMRLIKNIEGRFGGIDILVNNAGIGVYGDTEKTSLDDFRSVMEVNFFGAVRCMFEVLPLMKREGRGYIVNIASVAARHGVPYLGAYCASKAALAVLTQSLRAEMAKSGISFIVVYPGYTQTGFFVNEKKVGGAHRPSGPYASPQKVAKAIVKAVESNRRDVVLSLQGKALVVFQSILPWLAESTMERIASELRDKKEVFNG